MACKEIDKGNRQHANGRHGEPGGVKCPRKKLRSENGARDSKVKNGCEMANAQTAAKGKREAKLGPERNREARRAPGTAKVKNGWETANTQTGATGKRQPKSVQERNREAKEGPGKKWAGTSGPGIPKVERRARNRQRANGRLGEPGGERCPRKKSGGEKGSRDSQSRKQARNRLKDTAISNG